MNNKNSAEKKIIIYCQHSVGIGHLIRSFSICNSLKDSFKVTLISGGVFPKGIKIPSGVDFIQLSPLEIDNNQIKPVSIDKTAYEVLLKRQKKIITIFKDIKPDVFITEYFPFGKIQFMGELIPVLKFIKNNNTNTKIICSSRDILEPTSTNNKIYQDFSVKIINDFYDKILVHGDERLITFDQTFPLSKKLKAPIYYTGYLTNSNCEEKKSRDHLNEIVLSAGGGKIAHPFIFKFVKAFRLYGFGDNIVLKVIPGPNYPNEKLKVLYDFVKDDTNIILKQTVEDLTSLWKNARLSISPAGYNTLIELVSSGVPAIVAPYRNETNSEQKIRSNIFNQMGLIKSMFYENMDEKQIAFAVKEALNFRPSDQKINLDGTTKTKEFIEDFIGLK